MRAFLIAFLLAIPAFLLPTATSGAHACVGPADPSLPPSVAPDAVPGILAVGVVGPLCSPRSPAIVGASPACPSPPFVGPVAGAWCGPVLAPGAFVECTWGGVTSVPTSYVAGFDFNGDGEIRWLDAESLRGPIGAYPFGSAVKNSLSIPGRFIAYPVSGTVASPLDLTWLACA